MNWIETKYLLWFYAKQPKNKLLDKFGSNLNNKLNKEFEKEHLKSNLTD